MGLSTGICECTNACLWVPVVMSGKWWAVRGSGMAYQWASGEAWWVSLSIHVPWDKQKLTWHTGGFFRGVKLSHLHLSGAEPTDRDDSWVRGSGCPALLVLYLWAPAKAWRNFMFCITHLCENKNLGNSSFFKSLRSTAVCYTVIA